MTLNILSQEFIEKYMLQRLRPSTIRGYRVNLERHILPILGGLEVGDITVDTLDYLTTVLTQNLSNRSAVYAHATLRKMLNYAIRRGYIDRNPYTMADLPRVEKYRYRVFRPDEIRNIFELVKGTPLEVPITLALYYGLRRGECLGVIPSLDLDPHTHVLHVQRTRSVEYGKTVVTPCKTDKSDRYILLAEPHAEMLRGMMTSAERYACPLSPGSLDWHYKAFLRKHGLPMIRFHDLRHSYATYMLSQDINPKIVSSVLGHSGVAITLDIYSHPSVSMQRTCLQAMAGL